MCTCSDAVDAEHGQRAARGAEDGAAADPAAQAHARHQEDARHIHTPSTYLPTYLTL